MRCADHARTLSVDVWQRVFGGFDRAMIRDDYAYQTDTASINLAGIIKQCSRGVIKVLSFGRFHPDRI